VPLAPGTENGEADIQGDRFASGNWPYRGHADGGESIIVYTFADQGAMDADTARNPGPQDGQVTINGHLWSMTVQAVPLDAGGFMYQVSPQKIAAETHGTIQS
jgi:hypothetical protein